MTRVECGEWVLEVDVEATRRAYTTIKVGDPETCGCLYCRNFAAVRHVAYPAAALELYDRLGNTPDREAETYEEGPSETGDLHHYGGWHHVIGRIVQKCDRDVPLAPGFSVGFFESRSCAEPAF